MDIRKFKESTPGQIVPIDGGEHAYVPNPLPPKWKFPEKLWPLLLEAKEKLMLLEGLGRNLRDPGILFQPLQGREAIQSSALEGTYATPRELLLFELEPKQPTEQDDPANTWKEYSITNWRCGTPPARNSLYRCGSFANCMKSSWTGYAAESIHLASFDSFKWPLALRGDSFRPHRIVFPNVSTLSKGTFTRATITTHSWTVSWLTTSSRPSIRFGMGTGESAAFSCR
jgi:Fic/DOC family N-terminal